MKRLVIPMEEEALLDWLRAVTAAVRSTYGVQNETANRMMLYMFGMKLALLYPELAQAILAKLPADCTDGLDEAARNAVSPFQFEETP